MRRIIMKKYRVVYYTVSGCRSKDFDSKQDAVEFYERHIKKHPEYQNSQWNRTELVEF